MPIKHSVQHRCTCRAMHTKGHNEFAKGGVEISKKIKRKGETIEGGDLDFSLPMNRWPGGHKRG